jgi:hypothetical protein
MDIATFEVMRAATDTRNTLWAAAMAAKVRTGSDVQLEVASAVRSLISSGDLVLGRATWSGAQVEALQPAEVERAMSDESQWHPRRLPWSKRLRLIATASGATRFSRGEYGAPEPIHNPPRNLADTLELQAIGCTEAFGMAVAVTGFVLCSACGFLLANGGVPKDLNDWSLGALAGWIVGGSIGLAAATAVWAKIAPPPERSELADYVIPDQFNDGPDVNTFDAFGDPRF